MGLIVQWVRGFCFVAIGWCVLQADSYHATPVERSSASVEAVIGGIAPHG